MGKNPRDASVRACADPPPAQARQHGQADRVGKHSVFVIVLFVFAVHVVRVIFGVLVISLFVILTYT